MGLSRASHLHSTSETRINSRICLGMLVDGVLSCYNAYKSDRFRVIMWQFLPKQSIPRKGTETARGIRRCLIPLPKQSIPRKGTETDPRRREPPGADRNNLYPARGRKHDRKLRDAELQHETIYTPQGDGNVSPSRQAYISRPETIYTPQGDGNAVYRRLQICGRAKQSIPRKGTETSLLSI